MGGFYTPLYVPLQLGTQMSCMKGELPSSNCCSDSHLGESGHMERDFLSPKSGGFALLVLDAMSRVLGG